ncbi:MAG: 5'/3'-nucleotidase SurE [Rikenellaceae bacterium]
MENSNKPIIFVTNDDGYNAPGIQSAIKVARKFGRVIVVAPEYHQSGMAHAITMHNPLYLRKVIQEPDLEIYACTGTPVDCVKMAFDYLLKDHKPALSISGINHGSNAAINVLYSGTMGAAIEASFYGAPSVGLSMLDFRLDADFEASEIYAEKIIAQILERNITEQFCLNVNIPIARPEEIKGIMMCRQNKGFWREKFVCGTDPRGRDYYWLTGEFDNAEMEACDTDEWALRNNYVSVVPIQVDFTHYTQVEQMKKWEF